MVKMRLAFEDCQARKILMTNVCSLVLLTSLGFFICQVVEGERKKNNGVLHQFQIE